MKLIYNLQKLKKIKKILKACIIALMFLYIFLIPSFGESTSFFGKSIYVVMIVFSVFVIFYCILFDDFKINKYALLVPAFCVFAFIGTAIYSHSFRRWFSLVLLTISFFAFLYAFKILKNKFFIMQIISYSLLCFSIYFIFHYRNELIHFKDFATGKFRLGFYFDNPNGVATFETISFATSLYILLFYKKRIRFFQIIPLIFSIIVGVSTGSRTFIFAVILLVILFLFFVFKKHKWIYLITLAILTIAFILFLQIPFMATIRDRLIIAFQTIFGVGNNVDTSTLSRMIWLDYGFFLGLKNALVGLGADGFVTFSGVNTYAHNNFAEVVCDFGVCGLVLFYLPLLILLLFSLKNNNPNKPLVISLAVYYIAISFTNVLYYKKMYYVIMAFLFYLVFFDTCIKNSNHSKEINKILITCDSMEAGGAEKVIATLSNEFVNKGINVVIVGVSDYKEAKSFYNLNNLINYISLNSSFKRKACFFKRIILLKRVIKNENPDVIISFLPHINVYTWLGTMFSNTPFIVSERNDPYSDPKSKILRLLKRISFTWADGCVFQTIEAMNFYKDSIIEKSTVIENPVQRSAFIEHKKKEKVILTVGRLTEQKNHILLLESFAKANKVLQNNYILRIYGDGPLKGKLLDEAKKLDISEIVDFKGKDQSWQKNEINDALFVLSSDYEGMPNSLLEALVLGIPCVSVDCPCGGPRDLKNRGFNLCLTNVRDSNSLASAIVTTLSAYGENFDEHNILQYDQFKAEQIASKWLKFIKETTYEE